mgnify:CR=1 FL=1
MVQAPARPGRRTSPRRDHGPGPFAGVVRVHARSARPRRRRVGARIRAVHSIGGVGGVVRRRPLDEVEAGAQPRHLGGDRRLDGLEARPQLGELRLERGRRRRRDLCRAPRRWRVGCHKRTAPGPRRMRRGGRRAHDRRARGTATITHQHQSGCVAARPAPCTTGTDGSGQARGARAPASATRGLVCWYWRDVGCSVVEFTGTVSRQSYVTVLSWTPELKPEGSLRSPPGRVRLARWQCSRCTMGRV